MHVDSDSTGGRVIADWRRHRSDRYGGEWLAGSHGINAPRDIAVDREEIAERKRRDREALAGGNGTSGATKSAATTGNVSATTVSATARR